jgi:CheY-like chemotaxis protein
MDGNQLAGAVKALSVETPVVLLTGSGEKPQSDASSHVDDILNKPFRLAALRQVLKQFELDRSCSTA